MSTSKGQEAVKMGGRAATNIPKIPSPASNHRKRVIFTNHQKMEPPNPTVPKAAETTPTIALTKVLLKAWGPDTHMAVYSQTGGNKGPLQAHQGLRGDCVALVDGPVRLTARCSMAAEPSRNTSGRVGGEEPRQLQPRERKLTKLRLTSEAANCANLHEGWATNMEIRLRLPRQTHACNVNERPKCPRIPVAYEIQGWAPLGWVLLPEESSGASGTQHRC